MTPMDAIKWTNDNSGFLSLLIFIATLLFAWVTGIIKNLMKRPDLKISTIGDATFCSWAPTQNTKVRLAALLYLQIINTGAAPTEVRKVMLGVKASADGHFVWFDSVVSLHDFAHTIGENLRVFPFLIQKNYLIPNQTRNYLRVGAMATGVVYFESILLNISDIPLELDSIAVKVRCFDTFGKHYDTELALQVIPLETSKKYKPYFGETLNNIEGRELESWSYIVDNPPIPEQDKSLTTLKRCCNIQIKKEFQWLKNLFFL